MISDAKAAFDPHLLMSSGHVHLHRHLWDEKLRPGELFARGDPTNKVICKRDTIIDAASYDWMEWQAGYVSGAMLVPSSRARRLVGDCCADRGLHGDVPVWSHHGGVLIGMIQEAFEVSEEAARVRLLKLRLITSTDRQASLSSQADCRLPVKTRICVSF